MIVPMTAEHAAYVAARMANDDLLEVQEMAWPSEHFAEEFAARCMQTCGVKVCLLAPDGEPVAVGGMALAYPGVATAWMVGTDRVPELALELTRFGRRLVKDALAHDWHRVQAFSAVFHRRSHGWLEAIGLQVEARLAKWGHSGADFILYSAVR